VVVDEDDVIVEVGVIVMTVVAALEVELVVELVVVPDEVEVLNRLLVFTEVAALVVVALVVDALPVDVTLVAERVTEVDVADMLPDVTLVVDREALDELVAEDVLRSEVDVIVDRVVGDETTELNEVELPVDIEDVVKLVVETELKVGEDNSVPELTDVAVTEETEVTEAEVDTDVAELSVLLGTELVREEEEVEDKLVLDTELVLVGRTIVVLEEMLELTIDVLVGSTVVEVVDFVVDFVEVVDLTDVELG